MLLLLERGVGGGGWGVARVLHCVLEARMAGAKQQASGQTSLSPEMESLANCVD